MDLVRRALADALAVVLPVECSGCGEPGWSVCPVCRLALAATPSIRRLDGVDVVSSCTYADRVAHVLTAFKDSGRLDAARPLGAALRGAVEDAIDRLDPSESMADLSPLLAVPIPGSRSSRRRRGYEPVAVIARRARIPLHPVLRLTRTVADQAALGLEERHRNRDGALAATRELAGADVLLIDDVVTTGATLLDAARAVRAAGGRVRGAATVAATPLRGRRATST